MINNFIFDLRHLKTEVYFLVHYLEEHIILKTKNLLMVLLLISKVPRAISTQ